VGKLFEFKGRTPRMGTKGGEWGEFGNREKKMVRVDKNIKEAFSWAAHLQNKKSLRRGREKKVLL